VVRTDGRDNGTESANGRVEGDEDDEDDENADTDLVAEVYVQPDRVRVEFVSAPDAVADAGAADATTPSPADD
jgi:hypothetical protein